MSEPVIDQQTDAALAAIAALARAAIVADVGAEALTKVYSEPRPPHDLDDTDLPVLVIRRGRERWKRRSSTSRVRLIDVLFEYTLPSADVVKERELRWPTLQRVWESLCMAVLDGAHDELDDGAEVLEAASVVADEDSPDVRYVLGAGGRETDAEQRFRRPFFTGVITVEHDPEAVDATTLDKFLSLHASYDLVQTDESADTPSQPGVSTDEGPVETNLPDFDIADL